MKFTKPKLDVISTDIHNLGGVRNGFYQHLSQSPAYLIVFAVVALGYLAVEIIYCYHAWLLADEFQFGVASVYPLLSKMPYRDFIPYKTVLGYYIQSIPLLMVHDPWYRFIAIKIEMVIINSIALFGLGAILKRMFGFLPAILAMLLLVLVPNFLIYSGKLRVDMLTSWATMASVLFLLNKRFIWAGIFCGLSALISQKAAMHGVGCAFYFAAAVLIARDWRYVKYAVQFGIAAAVVIAIYILFFGYFAGVGNVALLVFAQKSLIHYSTITSEVGTLQFSWLYVTASAALFSGLALIAVFRLPIYWLKNRSNLNFLLMPAYFIGLVGVMLQIARPYSYDYVLIIPQAAILLAMFFHVELKTWPTWPVPQKVIAVIVILVAGLLIPGRNVFYLRNYLGQDNTIQRQTVQLAAHLLSSGGTYFYTRQIIFDGTPALKSFSHIDPDRFVRLRSATDKKLQNIYDQMVANHMKLVIANKSFNLLPRYFRTLVFKNFLRWRYWIFLYAPLIEPKQHQINIRFTGTYQLLFDRKYSDTFSSQNKYIILDGRHYVVGDKLHLNKGEHKIKINTPIRLRLIPKIN